MNDKPDILSAADEDERDFLAAFLDKVGSEADRTVTDSRLDWLLEKLCKRKEQIARNDDIAKARLLQIEDWRQGENAKIERAAGWIE